MFDRVFDLWFPIGAGMRTVTEDLPRDEDWNFYRPEAVR